jgi:hypothetical protein
VKWTHSNEITENKRLDAVDLNEASTGIPQAQRQVEGPSTPPFEAWRQFQRLNSVIHPGLTKVEFRKLFKLCGICGQIKTREAFPFHACLVEPVQTDSEESE